jgi:hypothetical protein
VILIVPYATQGRVNVVASIITRPVAFIYQLVLTLTGNG